MRRIAIQLSEEERKTLNCFRQKGLHHARENTRAHILAALDQQVPDQQIRDVLWCELNGDLAHARGVPPKGA